MKTMNAQAMAASLGVALVLGGCAAPLRQLHDSNAFLVAADNLDMSVLDKCSNNNHRSCVGVLIVQSQDKCADFLNGLVLAENTSNTAFDVATTLFSALATAFTPLSTVHGLAAAATVSNGWKSAINANVYAKAAAANYAQAIQATYYHDVGTYLVALQAMPEEQVVPTIEAAKIQVIHRECSLASAQSTIAKTLQPGEHGESPPQGSTTTAPEVGRAIR